MESLSVLPIGQAVLLHGDIPATVTAITIRGNKAGPLVAYYEVAWWDGRVRRSEFVGADEVAVPPATPPAIRIGFAP